MDLKITSDSENKLLNRREIKFVLEQDGGTMKKDELAKQLCKKLNLNPESTIIVKINQGFGRKESYGTAHSYDSKESLQKYEPKHLLERIGKKSSKEEKKEEAKE